MNWKLLKLSCLQAQIIDVKCEKITINRPFWILQANVNVNVDADTDDAELQFFALTHIFSIKN